MCFFGLALVSTVHISAARPAFLIVGGAIAWLFESLYTGLWHGRMPGTRTGPAVALALLWTVSIALLAVGILAPLSYRLYDVHELFMSERNKYPAENEAFESLARVARVSSDFAVGPMFERAPAATTSYGWRDHELARHPSAAPVPLPRPSRLAGAAPRS